MKEQLSNILMNVKARESYVKYKSLTLVQGHNGKAKNWAWSSGKVDVVWTQLSEILNLRDNSPLQTLCLARPNSIQ